MPTFNLIPFSSDERISPIQIHGDVSFANRVVRAAFVIHADATTLIIPEPLGEPARRDELWKSTCCELFFGPRGESRYVEMNLSPSGDWNAYSFTGYREGMAPLPVAQIATRRLRTPHELKLELELTIDDSFALASPCDLAVSAVLEHSDHGRSFWALRHTAERPDFHRRDSFILAT